MPKLLTGKKKEEKPKQYILENLSRNVPYNDYLKPPLGMWAMKNLGRLVCVGPGNQWTQIHFTGPPGRTAAIYHPLTFQLRKWEYQVFRVDEWLEVSPIHQSYYQLTEKQKEELETKIKSGLASAAQSVGDLELLKHDERRYKEFDNYFKQKDEHSLKAVFIDQVDMHTGDISMRNIVARWPTLIIDFMKLADTDTIPDEVKKKLDVSKAEAVVLVTKNKLYKQWKDMFGPQLTERLGRIQQLIQSREESVKQYREWLKPYVARHRLLKEGLERPDVRKMLTTHFIPAGGIATSLSILKIWAWRDLASSEIKRPSGEILAKKPVDPYDAWTQRELIFDREKGLVVKYPWITKEWADKKVGEIKKATPRLMNLERLYYSFFELTFNRSNIRLADGTEIEDCVFDINTLFMSQNTLLVKILELRAKEEELEIYVNKLLGLPVYPVAEEKPYKPPQPTQIPNLGFLKFFKRGPYEHDFDDRIAKFYLKPLATTRYVPIVAFIKQRVGMGQ